MILLHPSLKLLDLRFRKYIFSIVEFRICQQCMKLISCLPRVTGVITCKNKGGCVDSPQLFWRKPTKVRKATRLYPAP